MSIWGWFLVITALLYWLQTRHQQRRLGMLARHLSGTQVERILGSLIDGYLRAIGESDPERQRQVWSYLEGQERQLVQQFERFTQSFASEPEHETRVSTLVLPLPLAEQVLPQLSFDMRQALNLHLEAIRSISDTAQNVQFSDSPQKRKDLAFTMTAELLLMQHTCHWFGRSRAVASMRLVGRHHTSYDQVLASVQPQTRKAYLHLIRR